MMASGGSILESTLTNRMMLFYNIFKKVRGKSTGAAFAAFSAYCIATQ
jgi:hypothetical protein